MLFRSGHTHDGIQVCDVGGKPLRFVESPTLPDAEVPGAGGILRATLHQIMSEQLRSIGVNVDLQGMEWNAMLARRTKKDAPDQGGWHIFHTTAGGASQALPFSNLGTLTACDAAWFGWPCDMEAEKMRQAFIRETDPAKQKQLAETMHRRLWEENIPVLPVGQYQQPFLWRKNITGIMKANTVVYWNIEKN